MTDPVILMVEVIVPSNRNCFDCAGCIEAFDDHCRKKVTNLFPKYKLCSTRWQWSEDREELKTVICYMVRKD